VDNKELQLREWARAGAKSRLAELMAEAASIIEAFPDMGTTKRDATSARPRVGRKPGFKLSEEARARMAEGQRQRWAARREAEAQQVNSAPVEAVS
jgi:hypothetical protein